MTIGELARAAGVNVQTIRYYEREGVLPEPHRWPDSGYRDYDDETLTLLLFIRSAKDLGFTLREIKELLDMRILPGDSCAEVRRMLVAKIADIDRRQRDLRRLRRVLKKLEATCEDRPYSGSCPALWAMER
jgi:MerR family mercuric resistance operon transcriptional regulator